MSSLYYEIFKETDFKKQFFMPCVIYAQVICSAYFNGEETGFSAGITTGRDEKNSSFKIVGFWILTHILCKLLSFLQFLSFVFCLCPNWSYSFLKHFLTFPFTYQPQETFLIFKKETYLLRILFSTVFTQVVCRPLSLSDTMSVIFFKIFHVYAMYFKLVSKSIQLDSSGYPFQKLSVNLSSNSEAIL